MSGKVICYVLITYGANPSGSIRTHPAAKAQIGLFQKSLERFPQVKAKFVVDYARRIEGLGSLPKLQRMLVALSDIDGPSICIDDLSRVFRITNLQQRQNLIEELQEFGKYIFSIGHQKRLSEFSSDEIRNLILFPEKSKRLARQDRSRDTTSARLSSAKSRAETSKKNAHLLRQVEEELKGTESRVTLQMIADGANARGMRTSRGKEWTPQNVGRMLK
ncbi:hypothetical protein [Sediminimonas qiaohouensis]|uniref:hypothetical protein n=1 Tax=Sediminimonas qiaohouensis TaxID=552061 RepID=UPI00047ABA1D|nr:hypothetical protein [Sediminimonas qiaohouensis]